MHIFKWFSGSIFLKPFPIDLMLNFVLRIQPFF